MAEFDSDNQLDIFSETNKETNRIEQIVHMVGKQIGHGNILGIITDPFIFIFRLYFILVTRMRFQI